MKSSMYGKFLLRSSNILNIENDDKYCFLWSMQASLHPCNKVHPNRVTISKQYFNELNIQYFVLSDGFKCSDVQIFEKLNKVSITLIELNFCQDQKN